MAHTLIGLWRERLTLIADAATEVVLSEIVPPGEMWHIDVVGVRDDTTAAADCQMSIWWGAYAHHIFQFTNAGTVWTQNGTIEIWLREGEQLRFDWSSLVAGDILEMHISGEKFRHTEMAA